MSRDLSAWQARRVQLDELDALTDRIGPLLDRMDAIWRRVEQSYEIGRPSTSR